MANVTNKTTEGKTRDSRTEDRVVAMVLRVGAYASIVLILVGGLLSLLHAGAGHRVTEIGVIVLMSTPISRVFVAAIVFWREGDRRYALVSLGVFVILVGTSTMAALKILPTLEH